MNLLVHVVMVFLAAVTLVTIVWVVFPAWAERVFDRLDEWQYNVRHAAEHQRVRTEMRRRQVAARNLIEDRDPVPPLSVEEQVEIAEEFSLRVGEDVKVTEFNLRSAVEAQRAQPRRFEPETGEWVE